MKRIFNIVLMILVIATMITACSSAKEVPVGTYIADGNLATVIVQDANEIMITGPLEVSAAFTGQYIISGHKLTLSFAELDDHVFSIEYNSLVLESGEWLENWIEQGTVFHLSEE